MDWNYDTTSAPSGVRLIVSFGELMMHDAQEATRDGSGTFRDRDGKVIPDAYAWMPYPLSASFNEPMQG